MRREQAQSFQNRRAEPVKCSIELLGLYKPWHPIYKRIEFKKGIASLAVLVGEVAIITKEQVVERNASWFIKSRQDCFFKHGLRTWFDL